MLLLTPAYATHDVPNNAALAESHVLSVGACAAELRRELQIEVAAKGENGTTCEKKNS